jgi:hypothetical protein
MRITPDREIADGKIAAGLGQPPTFRLGRARTPNNFLTLDDFDFAGGFQRLRHIGLVTPVQIHEAFVNVFPSI